MRRDLRAGLIGLGAMGQQHARVLSQLDGVELVGIADPQGARKGTTPVPVVRSLPELLALDLDYAVVACPTSMHEAVGLELAANGVCALIEKPLAQSVEAARRLVEAFERHCLVASVGHIERYNPALRNLRTRLEAGELGEVFQVATRRQGPFPRRIMDVGVIMDLATHDIDLTSWMTGQPYASVSARTLRRSGRPYEDMVAAVGELADGTIVNHLVNWLSPLKERSTVVTGEHGCFVADTLTADLSFYANGAASTEWEVLRNFRGITEGSMIRYAITKREPLWVEHECFRDAVRGVRSDIVALREGLRTVEVASAVVRSAAQAGTVPCGPASDFPAAVKGS
ncbi:Gfo/Idh/MocA family oxidoreductase [Nonomuraea sp. NPDC049625]|uniref:Gfo/Idh/MocA family protein n=1 Tax=Nonomuraea sp. NPDC049625 TaxID=3155775 RepID=UPI003420F813